MENPFICIYTRTMESSKMGGGHLHEDVGDYGTHALRVQIFPTTIFCLYRAVAYYH